MAPVTAKISIFTVLVLSCVTLICAEAEIRPQCLLNRMDCDFRHDFTPRPEENEYGIYGTRIKKFCGPAKPLKCYIRNRNNRVKTINIVGGDETIKNIFSPGSQLREPKRYGNQMYIKYRVVCPENHLVVFELKKLELEEPNCERKCVDFLRVFSGNRLIGEVCGTNKDRLEDILLLTRSVDVLFRTSDTNRSAGFEATITCIDNRESSRGSLRAGDDGTITDPLAGLPGGDDRGSVGPPGAVDRRTEASSGFEVEFNRAVDEIRRTTDHYRRIGLFEYYKRNFPHLFRLEEVIIEFGHSFEYINNKLTIMITQGGSIVDSFDNIQVVKILNGRGEVTVFRVNAKSRSGGLPLTINGPGTLHIVGCSAFYTRFVVNPLGILPLAAEEEFIVRTLTSEHFERNVLELPEEALCPDILDPPSFAEESVLLTDDPDDAVDNNVTECPRPENTANSTCNWSDSSVLMALANCNAPNVVVRTISRVAVNCTRVFQPGRIEALLADPLSVDCVIVSLPDSEYSVRCVDNRKGNIWFKSCSVVDLDSGDYTSLNSFCSPPSFRFPLTLLSPGRKQLVLVAKDTSGNRVTVTTDFSH